MKNMKRIGSLVLVLALCLALGVSAFAAGDGSITISDAKAGQTYTIYKMFDLTYSVNESGQADESSSYSYKVVEAWEGFFAENGAGASYVTLDNNGYVTGWVEDIDAAAFAQAALAYAKENEIKGTDTGTAESDGELTFSNLDYGYYLVDSSLGALCMLDSTTPDVTITEKNTVPSIAKYVYDNEHDMESDDASVLDTITYELVIEDAANVTNLVVHDAAGTDLNLAIDSIAVYNGSDAVEASNYTVASSGLSDDCTFELKFTDSFLATLTAAGDGADGDTLTIQVTATITGSGDDFDGDEAKYDNIAWLTYGDNSTKSEEAEADVYSYGFEIYKYTGSGESETPLADAKFVIQNSDGEYATFANGVLTGWVSSQESATVLVSSGEEKSNIVVEGLDEGTYTITEAEAPDGYNMLTGTVSVTITPVTDGDSPYSTFTVTYTLPGQDSSSDANDNVVMIQNNAGSEMPSTGGIGTTIFYVVGAILVCGAAVLLVTRKRLGKENG